MADQKDDFGLEVLRGRVTLAVEGLKALLLVNGGAAVAVLTYLGSLATDGPNAARLPDTRSALLRFAAGLLCALLAFVVAYVAQARLHQEHVGGTAAAKREIHHHWINAGGVLAVASALAFGLGAWLAATALGSGR